MYRLLKLTYRKLIPNSIHYRIEPFIRLFIYYLFYKGALVKCSICLSDAKKFISISFKESEDKLCPKCGSLSRSRALVKYVEDNFQNEKLKILDFSPHRSIHDFFKSKFENYISTDFEDQFYAEKNYDITEIEEKDNSFDLIICFHVLEHILEDDKAINELHRILKKNGVLIIQVPLKKGTTYEDFSITTPEDRLEAFGQEDHVRIYGHKSIEEKLKGFLFSVETVDISKNFNASDKKLFGISNKEIIFKCIK